MTTDRPRPHLRHHPARRRAGPRLQHDRAREAAHGRQAGRARRRHHGGGVPHRVGGRLRGGAARWAARCRSRSRRWRAAPPLDVERAAKALEKAQAAPPRIHVFLATSDIHLKYKLKKTRDAGAGRGGRGRSSWRASYVDDVEFSAEDGGRTEVDYLDRGLAGGRRRRRHDGQHPRHRRLLAPRGVRRADRAGRARAGRRRRSSASTVTTTSGWRSRTRWRPSRTARARSSARSTASASAPATARSRRSSWC